MLKLINIILSALLIALLSACATTNTATAKTEEQNQKIKTAKINAQLGIAYLERHNLQRSKQKLLLALEQGPNIPETWYSMGYFLEATGNKDDASIYYQKAISIAPTRGDAQNNYGTFLCRNGEYNESIKHFLLAVKDPAYLDPADAYENAGLCALKIPDKTAAANYFAQAVRHDPARTVSERKLRELNKYLAMDDKPANDISDEKVSAITTAEADDLETLTSMPPPAPKRIAYHSLKERHQQEENEDDPNSGLVKVPAVPVLADATPVAPAMAAPIKAVYKPIPKQKAKPKAVTAKLKVVPEKFHVERVALKPLKPLKPLKLTAKKVALKNKLKTVASAKLAASVKHKHVAVLKPARYPAKVKVAQAVAAKKHISAKGVVTV